MSPILFFVIFSWILMNFLANQIFEEIKVDLPLSNPNECAGSSSYSFNWGGGNNPLGEGERKRPEISIEESKNVLFANLFFIDPSCFIYFENESFSVNSKMYIPKLTFIFYWKIIFCLPPTTLLSQPTPRFARICSLKTNLGTLEN